MNPVVDQSVVALVYERDEAAKSDRCLGRPGLITVPFPFPTRITRRLPNGRYVLLAFWGIRTDLPDPMPCYRIIDPWARLARTTTRLAESLPALAAAIAEP